MADQLYHMPIIPFKGIPVSFFLFWALFVKHMPFWRRTCGCTHSGYLNKMLIIRNLWSSARGLMWSILYFIHVINKKWWQSNRFLQFHFSESYAFYKKYRAAINYQVKTDEIRYKYFDRCFINTGFYYTWMISTKVSVKTLK